MSAADWSVTRELVLSRDDHRCVECSRTRDLHIHHVLPRSMGGSDDPANLITLCAAHHAARHPKLSAGLARRVIERWCSRLAYWLDRDGRIVRETRHFGAALRLFGVPRFRHGQLAIVQAALRGESILVVSPTGSGKSLCFQLPAVLRPGLTVVLSPLKALMADQVSSLLRRMLPATFINSDLDQREKTIRYHLIQKSGFKFLYLAPERFFLSRPTEAQTIRKAAPSFLVIDEAHCIDKWGSDFRPEYGRIGEIRKMIGSPPVLAFTATAGVAMQNRILESIGTPNATVFVTGVDRPNIALIRWHVSRPKRHLAIAEAMRLAPSTGRVMIFVPTVKVGEELQRNLQGLHIDLPFYHASSGNSWEREQLVKRFTGESEPRIDCIICTNAFGMGLDVPDVRLVIHWQHPGSVEDYLQEFGRAGRDGGPAAAIVLYERNDSDQSLLRFMGTASVRTAKLKGHAAEEALANRHQQVELTANLVRDKNLCFRQAISAHFNSKPRQTKRRLNERLLSWAFEDRPHAIRSTLCCDRCNPGLVRPAGAAELLKMHYAAR